MTHRYKMKYKRLPWIWAGFGIGVSISLLAVWGITGLVQLIDRFKLPEEELAIFTSLFYGIIFFIALGGVRAESRRYKMLMSRRPYEEPPPPLSGVKVKIRRIKTTLWILFSAFSLGWLTPAFVIYWAAPKHPQWVITACGYMFSLIAGIAYALKKAPEIKTPFHYVMFFVGVCLGAMAADRLLAVVPLAL